MSGWNDWQSYLLNPFSDALLGRPATSPVLHRHARDFPGALETAREAAAQARQMGFEVDDHWIERYTRCSAFDRQDDFARLLGRSLIRPERLEIVGEWPRTPFVALFAHWGAGIPALEHLHKNGRQPSLVYQPESVSSMPTLPARLYDRVHMRVLLGFGNAIRLGGAHDAFVTAIAEGRCPVAVVDGLPRPTSRVVEVPRGQRNIRLRSALLQILADEQVPFAFFRCWLPEGADRRRLEISPAHQSGDLTEIAELAADFLLESILLDGSQWHFWMYAETFLGAAPAAGSIVPQEAA
ncbi:MAG: hypothetical protein ACXIUM_15135 [Wenzhouxiangella sp.]